MLKLYDPNVSSYGITLRDIVFVLKSAFECIRRQHSKENIVSFGEGMLLEISTNNFTSNPIRQNLSKIAI